MDSTPSPPAVTPSRLWSLDVLRGACALAVFLCHWHLWSDFAPRGAFERFVRGFLENGYSAFVNLTWPTGGHHPAVICFFVLSGFCIHYPAALRTLDGQPHPAWSVYFRRRFRRIMPAFWAACLLGLIFVLVEARHPSGSILLGEHATGSPGEISLRFAGLSGFYPREIFGGNYPLTTVAVEIVMYALYPAFHYFASRGHWTGLGLAFLALQVVALQLLNFLTPFWVFNSVLMLGIFWYVGALAADRFVKGRAHVRGIWFLLSWLGFLGLKGIPHFYGLNIIRQDAWAVVCALGMLWALGREARDPGARGRPLIRAMRYSGRISYSVYAMHAPAIMLATWLMIVVIGNRDYLLQLGATFTAALVATMVTFYGVERMFYRPRVE
ncbi:MAG: Acyltransferase family protein [Verrucomicrobia bacterium]|nr:Acyltransferase family protein [Verrucomicrobiota bacterium]